jgi:hypothetical protein
MFLIIFLLFSLFHPVPPGTFHQRPGQVITVPLPRS